MGAKQGMGGTRARAYNINNGIGDYFLVLWVNDFISNLSVEQLLENCSLNIEYSYSTTNELWPNKYIPVFIFFVKHCPICDYKKYPR